MPKPRIFEYAKSFLWKFDLEKQTYNYFWKAEMDLGQASDIISSAILISESPLYN